MIRHLETAKGRVSFELELPSTVKSATAALLAAGMKGSVCSPTDAAKDYEPRLLGELGDCYGEGMCAEVDGDLPVCE